MWLESKNVLGTHKNYETGWENIVVNRKSIKSVIHHVAADGKIAILGVLPQLINNGIYLETNLKNERGLISHIFASKTTIDGEPYAVTYVVLEDRCNRRYYDHSLIKITTLDQKNDQVPKNHQREFPRDSVAQTRPEETPLAKTSLNNILKKHLAVNTQREKK
jgi:hypothetical protein